MVSTRRKAARVLLVPALALAGAGTGSALEQVTVRDAVRGIGIEATLEIAPLPDDALPTAGALAEALARARRDGRMQRRQGMRLYLDVEGRSAVRVGHPGYRDLLAVIEPAPALTGWTLWLQPQDDDSLPAPPDTLHGHVVDPDTLQPMAGVRLRLAGRDEKTVSDGDGHFVLPFPAMDGPALRRERLVAIAPDGRRLERAVALAGGSDLRLLLDFTAHGDEDPGHRHLQPFDSRWQKPEPGRGGMAPAAEPPASVRVGYADASCSTICCTNACTHACVYDLETYVQRGLNDEWIASWNTQSLRAGSIAYRSYGAWHALNPVPGRGFDICSSACCQVNDADTSASTDLAVARTAGLMLERNGAVFRSEYSAENNCLLGSMSCSNGDLSCGDGYAGSPAANWPCLADPVSTGQACFGHGRGMSQWGTQRWSQAPYARTWRWQVDHYYNNHGNGGGLRTATMTRVLLLEGLRPRQRTRVPGDTLVIAYEARNLAATTHAQALLGASLRRPPGGYVDDPDNDTAVALPSGPSWTQRPFVLPASLPPGRYDVYGSLYIDVDENGAISSTDLAQALVQLTGALRVVDPSDLIFYDGLQ